MSFFILLCYEFGLRGEIREITRQVSTSPVQVIKPERGTYPQAYYMDMNVDIVGAK